MKKLWQRVRDWLIRKLGGMTEEEVAEAADEWNRQMDEASDRIEWLMNACDNITKKNIDLRVEIGQLNMKLEKRLTACEIKMGDLLIKPFGMKMECRNEYFISDGTHAQEEGIKEMQRYMAARLGQQLLEEGAIKINRKTDIIKQSFEMQMEVQVVC